MLEMSSIENIWKELLSLKYLRKSLWAIQSYYCRSLSFTLTALSFRNDAFFFFFNSRPIENKVIKQKLPLFSPLYLLYTYIQNLQGRVRISLFFSPLTEIFKRQGTPERSIGSISLLIITVSCKSIFWYLLLFPKRFFFSLTQGNECITVHSRMDKGHEIGRMSDVNVSTSSGKLVLGKSTDKN